MSEITIKQKKFIEKNRFSLSINEMAKSLGLPPEFINSYLHPGQASEYKDVSSPTPKNRPENKVRFHNFKVRDELSLDAKYIFIILITASILVYANALFGSFVSDDYGAIVNNPKVGDLLGHLTHPNIVGILNALTFNLVKYDPFLYHVNNLVFHVGSVILVYLIFKLLTKKTLWAGLTALLFAIHPIATESVVWISALPYVSYTFFGLLTLLIVVAVREKVIPQFWLGASVISLGLSFLSSEKGIAFVLIILVYLALFWPRKAALILLTSIVSVSAVFAKPLWAIFYQRVLDANPSFAGGITFYNPLVQIPVAIFTYTKLFLFPVNLTYYHESFTYNPTSLFFYYLLLLGFLSLGIFLYVKKLNVLLLGLAIFFLGLTPTLLPIRIAWIVAERYAYLSSVGFALGAGYLLLQVERFNRWAFLAATGIILTLYSGLAFRRTLDWKNEETLWPATVAVSADSTHAHYNMGELYRKKGDLTKAKEEYKIAVEIQPNNLEATNAMGTIDLQMGNSTEAAKLFDKAKTMSPQSVDSFVSLAISAIQQKRYDDALKLLNEAQKIDPKSALVYNTLGGLYFEMGDKKKAIEMLEKALSIDPGQVQVVQNLQYLKSLP